MNIYQKIAFGGFAVLAVASSLAKMYGYEALFQLTAFAFVVFLLTLSTTWKLIFLSSQAIGVVVGGIGHGVGIVGDMLSDWSEDRRRGITASPSSRVPDWDSPELQTSTDLDVPSFLDETLESQNS